MAGNRVTERGVASPRSTIRVTAGCVKSRSERILLILILSAGGRIGTVREYRVKDLGDDVIRPERIVGTTVLGGKTSFVVTRSRPSCSPRPSERSVTMARELGRINSLLKMRLLSDLVIASGPGGCVSLGRGNCLWGLTYEEGRDPSSSLLPLVFAGRSGWVFCWVGQCLGNNSGVRRGTTVRGLRARVGRRGSSTCIRAVNRFLVRRVRGIRDTTRTVLTASGAVGGDLRTVGARTGGGTMGKFTVFAPSRNFILMLGCFSVGVRGVRVPRIGIPIGGSSHFSIGLSSFLWENI